MNLGSAGGSLVIVEGGDLAAGNRVAVSSRTCATSAVALFTVRPGDPLEERAVVRLAPCPQLADHVVGISSGLAAQLGLEPRTDIPWSLTTQDVAQRSLAALSLELTVEQPLEDVVERLNHSNELGELTFYVQPDQDLSTVAVEIGDVTFRVIRADPPPGAMTTLMEVNEETRVQIFAPGMKSGVDLVILADCSGSMETPDLTDTHEQLGSIGLLQRLVGGRPPPLRRDEAQRRALKRLLDLRLRMSGRVSRIALVAFNDECVQRFPRSGGMQEMDESASPALVQEFRDAIGLLQAQNAGTDIGQALHFAAELLYRHGHPANDRLIVLVSDGANWAPKGDEATGEETTAFKEPISLTAHFHRDLKIHLHAIGIGTEATFRQWYDAQPGLRGKEPHIGLIPNHALLEELVRVGGGDPSRTGDADVLESYFSGLGLGVTRRLRPAKRRPLPEPNSRDLASFAGAAGRVDDVSFKAIQVRIDALVQEIWDLYHACNEYSSSERDRPAFRMTNKAFKSLSRDVRKKVSNAAEFQNFILAAQQTFYEARDIDSRTGKEGTLEGWLNDDRLRDLNAVRISFAHDLHLDKKSANKPRAAEAMRRHVGVSHVEDGDTARWLALQEGILRDIRDVLAGLCDMYRDPTRLPPLKPRPPPGFIWKS